MKNNIIEFAMYLTGHDKETIEQMHKDWLANLKYNKYALKRADSCKEKETWRSCKSWTENYLCLNSCGMHKIDKS